LFSGFLQKSKEKLNQVEHGRGGKAKFLVIRLKTALQTVDIYLLLFIKMETRK
jgi:hypothetical protein